MTPFQSTPVIWLAFEQHSVFENFAERIANFASVEKLDAGKDSRERFLDSLESHQSSWLMVGSDAADNEAFQSLAAEATENFEFFRCMVVGATDTSVWPENTIHLPKNSLSTMIIDRIRNESHVLRIFNSRLRHIRRLQQR